MARSGVLPALSHLCLSGDRERQIHAVAAMANIAEMVEGRTQKRMIEEGCIKPLLGLVDSPDVSGTGGRRCREHLCGSARARIALWICRRQAHRPKSYPTFPPPPARPFPLNQPGRGPRRSG